MKRFIEGTIKASPAFIIALSIVSIIGFLEIILNSFFGVSFAEYIDALLMLTIGTALVIEARMNQLKELKKGISSNNINQLVTAVIGTLAIIAGIFSIPAIKIIHPTFLAIKGIMSLVAIIFIIIQTWVIK